MKNLFHKCVPILAIIQIGVLLSVLFSNISQLDNPSSSSMFTWMLLVLVTETVFVVISLLTKNKKVYQIINIGLLAVISFVLLLFLYR